MKISFREFLTFDRDTQRALGNMNMEELKPSVKKKKMDELEVLLKKHDFWYQGISGDYREWKKQNENAQEITFDTFLDAICFMDIYTFGRLIDVITSEMNGNNPEVSFSDISGNIPTTNDIQTDVLFQEYKPRNRQCILTMNQLSIGTSVQCILTMT